MSIYGNGTGNSANLIRTEIYSQYVQEALRTPLLSDDFVFDVTDFGDGTTLNIPTLGEVTVRDRVEGQAAQYEALEDGVFTLSIGESKEAANALTKELLEDGYKGQFVMGRLANYQVDAIRKTYLTDILATQDQQTSDDANQVNGVDHRFVASASDNHVGPEDFFYAGYALDMANIPDAGRIAVVHPRVLFDIEKSSNITNLINNPSFEGIISSGMSEDLMASLYDIGGFKVMKSNMLASGIGETITHEGSANTVSSGVANLFMSIASPDVKPFARAWRRSPVTDSKYDMDTDQFKFVARARWGRGLIRPDGLVAVLGSI